MSTLHARAASLIAISLCWIPFGCGEGDETPAANLAPTAEITSGVVEGGTVSHDVRIAWTGHDADGYIARFEYAIDLPAVFTPEEIAGGDEGIELTEIPGTVDGPDRTRVSKVVDGEVVSFDWVHTTLPSKRFLFTTPVVDSLYPGAEPPWSWSGGHVIHVRAVDDDQAVSEPIRAAFTARTFAPETRIVDPQIQSEILSVGPRLRIAWEGEDLDSPRSPIAYLYKLLRIDDRGPILTLIEPDWRRILLEEADWTYQSADTPGVLLDLEVPGGYVFGVRAVDEAGAEDPFLDWGRNVFRFLALPMAGYPSLILSEPALGRFPRQPGASFRGTGRTEEAEVAVGQKLQFSWTATAEEYGGTIDAYAWGVDVPDLSAQGPGSGWSTWGPMTSTAEPIVFAAPGIHAIYVRVRDGQLGNVTVGAVLLSVRAFPRDREILFVDDVLDDIHPRDAQHDAFWRARFTSYGVEPDVFSAHGHDDVTYLVPRVPTLEELGRYKLVVWENRGSGFNGRSALLAGTTLTTRLPSYLAAGGNLWVGGAMSVSAMVPGTNEVTADFSYPKNMQNLRTSFAFQFLKLRSTRVNNDKGRDIRNTLLQVRPIDPGSAIYDTMDVDTSKLPPIQVQLSGIAYCDALFDPMFVEGEPGFRGDVDSLYAYGAAGPILYGRASQYDNRLVALRWHDPDPAREQGRIQWFGFPLYFFQDTQAQVTLNRSLDWFREEAP